MTIFYTHKKGSGNIGNMTSLTRQHFQSKTYPSYKKIRTLFQTLVAYTDTQKYKKKIVK